MEPNELYLKTLFCCSTCDGEIAPEEVSFVKELSLNDNTFEGMDVENILNSYVDEINKQGFEFLRDYLREVSDAELSDEQQVKLIEFAIKMIEADNQILYSEVKFFKKIRALLPVSDNTILDSLPDSEEYLLPDLATDSKLDEWNNIFFVQINLSE